MNTNSLFKDFKKYLSSYMYVYELCAFFVLMEARIGFFYLLELELQVVIVHLMWVLGIWLSSSARAQSGPSCYDIFFSPMCPFLSMKWLCDYSWNVWNLVSYSRMCVFKHCMTVVVIQLYIDFSIIYLCFRWHKFLQNVIDS